MLFILYVLALVRADSVGCFSLIDAVKTIGEYEYQTSSYCANQCNTPYVAISQGNMCYCLNSKPTSNEVSSSQCNIKCFGYGQEMCGGSSSYSVFVGNSDAEEVSVSSSASLQSTAASSSSVPSSSTQTSASSSTSTSTSVTKAASSATDEVIASTDSAEGSVVYRTVTQSDDASATASSSATGEADENENKDNNNTHKSSSVGPIVGGVVGGVAAVVIIALAIFFIIRHKRQSEDEDEEEYFDKPIGGTIKRNNGTFKLKGSVKNNALDMPMTNPFDHPHDEFADRTKSGLVDPRLNPVMLGRRRLSEGSLADETDYSRKILQVANPE